MIQSYFLAGLTQSNFATMNKIIAAGKTPGMLSSPTIGVSGGTLTIGAHEFLLPCGVYTDVTETVSISASDYGLARSATSSKWTIVWVIDTNLISAPALMLRSGLFTQEDASDYECIVGWLFYAGGNTDVGNVTVIPSYSKNKTLLKITRPSVEIVQASIPTDVSMQEITETYRASIAATSNSSTAQTITLRAYGMSEDAVPGELILRVRTSDEGFVLTTKISTSVGEQTALSGTTNLAAGETTLKLPLVYNRELFSPWEPFSINLYVRIPALGTFRLDQLAVTSTPRLSVG